MAEAERLQRLQELANEFAKLKIEVTEANSPKGENAYSLLEKTNTDFGEFIDEWVLLGEEQRQKVKVGHVNAQIDFNFVNSVLLVKVTAYLKVQQQQQSQQGDGENEMAIDGGSSMGDNNSVMQLASQSEEELAKRLQFGSFANDTVDLPQTKSDEMVEQSVMEASDVVNVQSEQAPIESQIDEKQNDQKIETDEVLASKMSYIQQGALLKPILQLEKVTQVNEASLNAVLKAIEKMNDHAKEHKVVIDKPMENVVVLHIEETLDDVSKQVWKPLIKRWMP